MIGPLMRIVSRALASTDDVVGLGDGSYAIRRDGDVVLTWSRSAARSLLLDGLPENVLTIDIDPKLHVPQEMLRSASDEAEEIADLSRSFGGQTVLLRIAQWGGHGGMPPGAGMGLGSGFGNSSPMAAPNQFSNYIARQQFDRSLDQARRGDEGGGWHKSLETRLSGDDLYGHTRTEKDRDMEPYKLSWEERVKLKKERYLDRVRESRQKKAGPKKPDPNSVEAIKLMAPKAENYISVEEKLGDHRETDGVQFRPGYHGPESQFTHFPRAVTAARTVEARSPVGYTTFDDMGDKLFPKDPYNQDTAGGDGSDRFHRMPSDMMGPQREDQSDVGELQQKYINGRPYEMNIDLLMNNWPHGTQPGEPQPIFTEGDKARIINLMRQRLRADEQPQAQVPPRGKTLEERLTSKHRQTPLNRTEPTAADYETEPYPYANDTAMRPPIRKHPGLSS